MAEQPPTYGDWFGIFDLSSMSAKACYISMAELNYDVVNDWLAMRHQFPKTRPCDYKQALIMVAMLSHPNAARFGARPGDRGARVFPYARKQLLDSVFTTMNAETLDRMLENIKRSLFNQITNLQQ